ncbi:hypothetical protein BDZ89DRAFT_1083119 [Hymenopellis radicata]|nr:hypothetical protein BDZ89DRAFT_1083119 [Hymenopellis radicata]
MMLTPVSPHRVSPELEAIWQKHAAHIAWSTTSPKDPEFHPTIVSGEGRIHALSPPPRVRKIIKRAKSVQLLAVAPSTSNSNRRLERIREDDDDDDCEPMRRASSSDDHRVLGKVGEDRDGGRQDPLAHLREKARNRKRMTAQARRRSASASDLRNSMHPMHNSRESGLGDPAVVVTAAARPFLISHSRQGSGSSTSTVTMAPSSDWTRPSSSTTEEDARISISSTAYNASSNMSHRHNSAADRTSFIDLLSPQESHFPIMSSPPSASQPPSSRTTSYASNNLSINSNTNVRSRSRSPKPPVPTSPKPDFAYRSSPNLALRRASPHGDLPPTTNYLQPETRAELVKKSRKLAQLFGQTPGAGVMPTSLPSYLDLPPSPRTRHMRGAMSVSESSQDHHQKPLPASPSGMERRHSTSIPPDDVYIEVGSERTSQVSHPYSRLPNGAESPQTSFIDLSDEEDDSNRRFDRPPSPSTHSLFESLSPDEQQEEIRRRKRDKLAKLHRFLGSRVPANLVLGLDETALTLPPLPPTPTCAMDSPDDKKVWLRRRRSSSVAAFPAWSDEVDRVKDDLNDREKAINVRRGKKMEKTLYHTRYGPSPSVLELPRADPTLLPAKFGRRTPPETGPSPPPSPKNLAKLRSKRNSRPSTAESSRHLLSQGSVSEDSHPPVRARSGSLVYSHYQHSLKLPLPQHLDPTTPTERRLSARSERRRSLPARTSTTSLASEYSLAESISSPKAEVTDFQLRRRRAAKLTAFFGVDYRDLIRDVLDSIENGLEHERKHGTINPEEAEDLLQRLRQIKTKRDGIF